MCADKTAPPDTTASERRQYRIDHGLCPLCGKESAPYYLCEDHRTYQAVGRMMKLMAKRGIVKDHGRTGYSIPLGWNGPDVSEFQWRPRMGELRPGDKRLRPRLGRMPVDLDETLIGIFREAGRRLTIEEIYEAWGKLRSRRKTESLAGDMAALIRAQRRRDERNGKRLAREDMHV